MSDHTDAMTIIIESLKRGDKLREMLVELREEVRVDPFAIEMNCEFEPQRTARLIIGLLEELCGR